jgi:hypothetical protein
MPSPRDSGSPPGIRRRSAIGLSATLLALAASIIGAATAGGAEPDFPAKDSRYHNLSEMTADVNAVASAHPAIVQVFSIGKSYQGRDILAAKISDNVATDENEPEVLIDALHHAREHLTVEQALYILHLLADGYATDATIKQIVDSREIYIIFALNPDGFVYDLTGTPYRAWRKNRQPNGTSRYIGTDLNRNYDYRWGCCNGSSTATSSPTYRGSRPWSAPETRVLRDFVNSRRIGGIQQIRAHITIHTNGELILWPYGYTKRDIPGDMTRADHATFVRLARDMAARNGYRAMQSSDLYVTDGDQIDWMYGVHRIFSFTFELYPTETPTVWGDHYPPDERIAAQVARNHDAFIYFLLHAGCPYLAIGYQVANCGPFFDDAEGTHGWVVDPDHKDTATQGRWQRSNPQPTSSNGAKQAGTATSGSRVFVTGAAAGASATANDLDGGVTTLRSAAIQLPNDPANIGPLTFRYVFAHDARSTSADRLRLLIEKEDGTRTPLWSVEGDGRDRDAAWRLAWLYVDAYAGQKIRLVFQATDGGPGNLVEAELDDIRIRRGS